jgi:hypothetical protein
MNFPSYIFSDLYQPVGIFRSHRASGAAAGRVEQKTPEQKEQTK